MRVLVTGAVAAGESTVAAELQRRGYGAFDTDADGLARREDEDGRPAELRDDPPADWFRRNHWNLDAARLGELLARGRRRCSAA